MAGNTPSIPVALAPPTAVQQAVIRLLAIPLLVYCAWLAEIFLLEGNRALFLEPATLPLVLYTVIGCILTGMIIPVLILRRSFLSGAVNMFQAGFRSLRRTVLACTLTGAACCLIALLMTPADPSRTALFYLFLLYLPTGIAAAMVCWVLAGTHLQALVRSGGAIASIPTGIVITAILFGLTIRVHTPATGLADPLGTGILLGIGAALFFFAVRDVYATSIVLATGMVLLFPARAGTGIPESLLPGVVFCAFLAVLALLAIHGYFVRTYTTVIVVPDSPIPNPGHEDPGS
ncbi:MAG: hypothetical protein CVV32_10820 [Methanomicrobiales archaeon HGW-Methanomicrobiales-3]|jgi:hypothetical protein|nr:MAG: hypothetical protein CVV32_10820 [Methanomicrobiales archaeon HGW-Methanomicrobiales-3]